MATMREYTQMLVTYSITLNNHSDPQTRQHSKHYFMFQFPIHSRMSTTSGTSTRPGGVTNDFQLESTRPSTTAAPSNIVHNDPTTTKRLGDDSFHCTASTSSCSLPTSSRRFTIDNRVVHDPHHVTRPSDSLSPPSNIV